MIINSENQKQCINAEPSNFIRIAKSLIDAFMLQEHKTMHHQSTLDFAHDFHILRLGLPRQTGSTYLAQWLCKEYNAVVLCANHCNAKNLKDNFNRIFPETDALIVSHDLYDPTKISNLKHINELIHYASQTKLFVCDDYKRFESSLCVTYLQFNFGLTHKFVML